MEDRDAPRIRLTREKLDFQEILGAVQGPGLGGTALFVGTVRDSEEGRPVGAIDYEAYESMALSELRAYAREAERRFGSKLAVFHRLGKVPAGEASIVVAAAAPHREEAFSACREVVERVKKDAPIWKSSFVTTPKR